MGEKHRTMTEQELAAIRARVDDATQGPWEIGQHYVSAYVNDGPHAYWQPPAEIPPGQCCWCVDGGVPLLRLAQDSETSGTVHIHGPIPFRALPNNTDSWRYISSTSLGTMITARVCSTPEDAAFIAAARTDVPLLLDEIAQLREALEATSACPYVNLHFPEDEALQR